MNCRDCLHYDACSMLYEKVKKRKVPTLSNNAEKKCSNFKDKDRYSEVVKCKECKYSKLHRTKSGLLDYWTCTHTNFETIVESFHYCSYGDRRSLFMRKWNYEKHEYEDYSVPIDWYVSTYETDMDKVVNCASCGKELPFGDTYTSLEIHTTVGFGYGVCEECYQREWERRRANG